MIEKQDIVTEFVDGEYYAITADRDFVIYQQNSGKGIHPTDSSYSSTKMEDLEDWNLGNWAAKEVRKATKLEKQHLQLCQIAGKYLPKPEKEVDFDLELAKYRVQVGDIEDTTKVLDCFVDNGYKKPSHYGDYTDKLCAAFGFGWQFEGRLCTGAKGDRPILSSKEFLEKFSKTKIEEWVTEFIDGEYYHCTSEYQQRTIVKAHGSSFAAFNYSIKLDMYEGIDQLHGSFKARKATKLEKQHAQLCEIYGQYIPMIGKELPFDLELAKYRVEGKSNEECKAIMACFAENGYDRWRDVGYDKAVFAAYSYDGFKGNVCSGYQDDDVYFGQKRLDVERPIISTQEFLTKFSKNPVVDSVASSEIKDLKKQIADLTEELQGQKALVTELDKRKSSLTTKLNVQKELAEESNKRESQLKQDLSELNAQFTGLSSNYSNLRTDRDAFRSKLEQANKDHLQQVSELNELVSSVEGQLDRESSSKEGAISAKDLMCVRYARAQGDKSEIKARLANVLGDIDRALADIKTPTGKITIAGEEYKTKQTLFGKWLG